MKHFLLVADVQNDFVTGPLGTDEARKAIAKITKKIESFDGEIFVLFDTHTPNYLNSIEGKHFPVKHCEKFTEGWQSVDKVKEAYSKKQFHVVEKGKLSSVRVLPGLMSYNAGGDDFDMTIIGFRTDVCVLSTAITLSSYYPDKEVYVDASCCAGTTPEAHDKAIELMKGCHINIL